MFFKCKYSIDVDCRDHEMGPFCYLVECLIHLPVAASAAFLARVYVKFICLVVLLQKGYFGLKTDYLPPKTDSNCSICLQEIFLQDMVHFSWAIVCIILMFGEV